MELIEYRRRIIINEPHIKKAEGNILTFNADIIKPLKACKVNFNPIQSGEGDPSPTNIRPIIGWTGMNLTRTGKNLMYGLEMGMSYITDTGVPYTRSGNARSAKIRVDFSKHQYYTLTYSTDCPSMLFAWDDRGEFVGRTAGTSTIPKRVQKASFTLGADGNRNYDHIKYIAVRWYNSGTKVIDNLVTDNIQLEAGYDKTDFEPITRNDIVLTFPAQGKNLFDKANATVYARAMNTATGKWVTYDAKSYAFRCKANTDYVVTAVRSELPLFRIAYIADSTIPDTGDINLYNAQERSSEGSLQIHTGNDATYLIMQPTESYADTTDIQVEEGTIVSPYEPFNNTVYGGTLDLLTGVLTVEYGIYDIGSLTWEVANGSGEIKYFRSSVLNGMKKIASTDIVANIYCSILKTVSAASIYFGLADDNSIGQDDSSNAKIRVKATSYNDDATAFKTAMNGVMLVYELATPQTFQLTPAQITALKGINNIWADIGETRIAYWSH